MSMSTNVQGFIPATDPTYLKHKKVLLACLEAEVELPAQTAKYFGQHEPEEYLLEEKLEVDIPTHEYSDEASQGFEVFIKDIPQGVEKIRFTNSW